MILGHSPGIGVIDRECQLFFIVLACFHLSHLCALVILCPVYHLHTAHDTMMSFAGGELNGSPSRAQLLSSPPRWQGIVAHASSQELRLMRLLLLPAEPRSCSRNKNEILIWKKAIFLHT